MILWIRTGCGHGSGVRGVRLRAARTHEPRQLPPFRRWVRAPLCACLSLLTLHPRWPVSYPNRSPHHLAISPSSLATQSTARSGSNGSRRRARGGGSRRAAAARAGPHGSPTARPDRGPLLKGAVRRLFLNARVQRPSLQDRSLGRRHLVDASCFPPLFLFMTPPPNPCTHPTPPPPRSAGT